VKSLVFEYIEDVVDDAINEYLDSDYPAMCAAEYARDKLDCSILPERLKGKDANEMDVTIRRLAKQDIAASITVTLGEYIPEASSEFLMEFDSAGLHNWAKNRFGVDIDTGDLREGGPGNRRKVQEMLEEAAFIKIDDADLDEISLFANNDYGPQRFSEWIKTKFTFEVNTDEIIKARNDDELRVRDLVIDKAQALYRERETALPVDFIMQNTMMIAKQDPTAAFESLIKWAHERVGLELSIDDIKTTPPAKIHAKLMEAMAVVVENDDLDGKIEGALATTSEDELDEYLKSQFNQGVTPRMRYLDDEDREDAIRARVETLDRPELVQFEQMVLIETLDQSWKDHLYEMDQLRDSIGFRAIAQTDPKIEYKREGQTMFLDMMRQIREKVTDVIFKARLAPPRPQGQMQRPPQQRQAPAQGAAQAPAKRPSPMGNIMGSSIMGPGFALTPKPQQQPKPNSEPKQAPETDPEA